MRAVGFQVAESSRAAMRHCCDEALISARLEQLDIGVMPASFKFARVQVSFDTASYGV